MSEIWQMSAADLAARIRNRELSSREVIEAHLHRIEAVNPQLNAVTSLLADEALEAADAADRAVNARRPVGPLCGVPMTVKENIDVKGSATTQGIAPLRNAIAQRDSPHIAELRDAGVIPIGRTNMPEFGMRWHTDNALHGATRNPWAVDRTPGGSSGGEAAAIAAGMSPLGMGSDGAGSLRWPAQCCGVTALKPSHGRVPVVSLGQVPFAFQLLGVHGPMARRVGDLRLAFHHMCSRGAGDAWHVAAPFEGAPVAKPIRVAVMSDPGGLGVHSDVAAAVTVAATQLKESGYVIDEREAPALMRATEIYTQIMSRFSRTTAEPLRAPVGMVSADFDRFWAGFLDPWEKAAGEPSHDPMMERAAIYRAWSELMQETPLVLAPIATQPAWKLGADLDPKWGAGWLTALRMVVVINLLGLPSVAIATGVAHGIPQAVQIIGPRFREDMCLAAAEAIEARIPAITPIDPRLKNEEAR
jgi:amidase